MAEGVGEAEVEHLHLAVLAEEDVARREIAVDDPVRVRVRQTLRNLDGDAQRLAHRNGARIRPPRKGASAQQLHDQIGPLRCASGVEQRHDVRVREPGRGFRLAEQPLLAHRPPRPGAHRLEGDEPSQLAVARFVHHPEAALPDLAQQLESADDRSRLERGRPARSLRRIRLAPHLLQHLRQRSGANTVRHGRCGAQGTGSGLVSRAATHGHPSPRSIVTSAAPASSWPPPDCDASG